MGEGIGEDATTLGIVCGERLTMLIERSGVGIYFVVAIRYGIVHGEVAHGVSSTDRHAVLLGEGKTGVVALIKLRPSGLHLVVAQCFEIEK